jgi:hypothetical protein
MKAGGTATERPQINMRATVSAAQEMKSQCMRKQLIWLTTQNM